MSFEDIQTKLESISEYEMTDTAKLRFIFDDVESLLNIGVRLRQVLEFLNKNGFNLTFRSFETTLYRIRKEAGKNETKTKTVNMEQKNKISNTSVSTKNETKTKKIGNFELPAQKTFHHNKDADKDDLLG